MDALRTAGAGDEHPAIRRVTALCGVRAALLDLDGTLVDSLPHITQALDAALRAHGRTHEVSHVAEITGLPLVEYFTVSLGLSLAEAEAIYATYLEVYRRDYVPLTKPLLGADALLDALEGAGIAMAVVTNKRMSATRAVIDVVGWTYRFRTVVAQDSVVNAKPAPDAARLALEALGIPASAAVFVGDSEADMGCGASAGCAAIIGIPGARPSEVLRAHGATHICRDLDEVRQLLIG